MKPNTKRLALSAILSAISLVLLYIGSIVPTGRIAFVAAAGLFPAVAVIRGGIPGGLYCYAVTGLLAFFLLQSKTPALMYIFFFGHWAVLKSLIERLDRLPLEWIVKLAAFNAFMTAFYRIAAWVMTDPPGMTFPVWLLYIIANAAFIAYDVGFSGMIRLYMNRFRK